MGRVGWESGLFSPPSPTDPTPFFLAGFSHPENTPVKEGCTYLIRESMEAISSQGAALTADSRAAEEQGRRPSRGGPGALPDAH